jgi:hypothetical protein
LYTAEVIPGAFELVGIDVEHLSVPYALHPIDNHYFCTCVTCQHMKQGHQWVSYRFQAKVRQ